MQRRRCEHTRHHPEIACRMQRKSQAPAPSIGCRVAASSPGPLPSALRLNTEPHRSSNPISGSTVGEYISLFLSSQALHSLLYLSHRVYLFPRRAFAISKGYHWAVAAAARRHPAKFRSPPRILPPHQPSRISLLLILHLSILNLRSPDRG
jgi:hypothetical protein